MKLAKHRHACDFSEIIYFGDGEWDYKTCSELGIRFIGVDARNDKKLSILGAREVIQDYKDSRAIISSIYGR